MCPAEFVGADIWTVLRFAALARRGAWPVAGGTLDQCRWFVDAAAWIWNEQAHWRAKKGLGGDW